ncbi:MAG: FGGY-family carbohydrate kinase [Synergistaceae bacterium]|nr:FGGY-family carbohydrate kinase [Synergistaceae bacterium]
MSDEVQELWHEHTKIETRITIDNAGGGSMHNFMGIDIGSYESKGVIIDENGDVLAIAVRPHGMDNPRPGYFEHDADGVWWKDFCSISKELLERSGIRPSSVAAVGASTLGADCVPVDENCRPLRKAILYGIDTRTSDELKFLNDYYGEEQVLKMRGSPFGSEDAVAKILWIRNHEPEIFSRTHKFCTGSTFITAKLTGEYVIDAFLAQTCFFPVYHGGKIRSDLIGEFFNPDKVANCRATTDIVGKVTAEAAHQTGLAEGTPVTAGTDDAAAEAISAGITDTGDMMVMLGSSMYLICITEREIRDERMWSSGYVIPDTFTLQGATNNAGTLTRWLGENIYRDFAAGPGRGKNSFELMMDDAGDIPPGSDGLVVLPYFAGERSPIGDPLAKGVFFGLTLRHKRGHIYRACLESIAYSLRQHLEIMESRGIRPDVLTAVGGGTKNPLWMQILADVSGKSIQTPAVNAGASYGDALIATIASGHNKNFSALKGIIRYETAYKPDMETNMKYEPYYDIFSRLYPATRDIMRQMPR